MLNFQSTGLNRAFHLLLYATVLILGLHFAQFSVGAAQRTSHSYVVLYTSARLVREGADFSRLYDDAWFGEQTQRFDPVYRDIYRPHSPITALILLPLSDLDYAKSRVLWTAFSVAFFAAASVRLLRELRVRGARLLLLMALMLLYDPLYVNLALGQSYILMFALLVVAWVGYRRGDNRALGIALGLMLGLKTAGVFLWILLVLQRRWSALAWGVGTAALLAAISLPIVGVEAWLTYFRQVGYFNGQPFLAVTAYQTPTSLFHHLFTYDARWNPTPLLIAPPLASVLTWGSTAVLVGVSLYAGIKRYRSQPQQDLLFAAFATVSVLIVPLALDYHYMLLLLPIILLAAQHGHRNWLVLVVSIALIATAIDFRQPALSIGWKALLAYPKLYGAVILWGLAVWQRRGIKQRRSAALSPTLSYTTSHEKEATG